MSTNKKTPNKGVPLATTPTSVTPTKLKLESEVERKDDTPSKKLKKTEVVSIGVCGSSTYGDCAIEIRNGYSV